MLCKVNGMVPDGKLNRHWGYARILSIDLKLTRPVGTESTFKGIVLTPGAASMSFLAESVRLTGYAYGSEL